MLAGITYTEISDQDEPEQGCPRLKSTYDITAHFPFAEYIFSGKLCLWGLSGAAVRSKFIIHLQGK
jgi:hypothetical protein